MEWEWLSEHVAPEERYEIAREQVDGGSLFGDAIHRIVVVGGIAYTLSDFAINVAHDEGWT